MDKKKPEITPLLPRSVARDFNLKIFPNMAEVKATAFSHDGEFTPIINDDGWCILKAKIDDKKLISPLSMTLVDCGFSVTLPKGHELHFRPLRDWPVLITDGTDKSHSEVRIQVNILNLSNNTYYLNYGDSFGEVCIRPITNIPIYLET
jgi:dUTPase